MNARTRSKLTGLALSAALAASAQAGWLQNRRAKKVARSEVAAMVQQEFAYLEAQGLSDPQTLPALETESAELFEEVWSDFKSWKRESDADYEDRYGLAADFLRAYYGTVGFRGVQRWIEEHGAPYVPMLGQAARAYEASIAPLSHTTPRTWSAGFHAFLQAEAARQQAAASEPPPAAPGVGDPAPSFLAPPPACSDEPQALFGLGGTLSAPQGSGPACDDAYAAQQAAGPVETEPAAATEPVEPVAEAPAEDALAAVTFEEPELPLEPLSRAELDLQLAAEAGNTWSAYRDDAEGVVPGKTYVVEDGDTLGALAVELSRAMLAEVRGYKMYAEAMTQLVEGTPIWGPRGLVACIRWVNQDLDPALAPGQEILLPTPLLLMQYRRDTAEAAPAL